MTKQEADRRLLNLLDKILTRTEAENVSNEELIGLNDSAHKLYITLCNSGALQIGGLDSTGSSGIMN